MDGQSAALHRDTPTLTVIDPRGLTVCWVAWYRHQADEAAIARSHRSVFDPAGRLTESRDPRLGESDGPANLVNIHSLSTQVLARDSVDAGWRVSLPGEAGQMLQGWDGRGTVRRSDYDALLRPTAVFENEQCVERLTYGDVDSTVHNQCGQLIRHDDPAGTRLSTEFSLTGAVIEQTQHFLADLILPDWPEPEPERDALLEPGAGAVSHWRFNPLGAPLEQTDAQGNLQRFVHTVAGQLHACFLQLNGQSEQCLVSDIRYDAQGRVESETAGNGVISSAAYGEKDGRLIRLKAVRSGGESLQDLTCDYDPVGNVIRLEDLAQPVRYFANQRIEPVSSYQYDTLYQLSEATGRELALVNHGPVFPDFQSPTDPTQLANYTQTYHYDAGGNLQQLTHVGSQNHSRTLVIARQSNRSLLVENDQPPTEEDIAAAFDANGNLLQLQAGQTLNWDLRNQLQEVRPIVRESGIDDSERYVYDASGQRLRKVRTTQAKAVTHMAEVRYLPGLEVRTDTATGEMLHVITAQAGRSSVRVLRWQEGKPDDLDNDQYRYSLTDHLGSSTLELDAQAQIISQESYYPFGGTSWWAGRNAIEASYKTVRYSGKERDATGLYYYGMRYYAPWLQRWINPDPAGEEDGLNLFCFVRNNPCSGFDNDGRGYEGLNDWLEMLLKYYGKVDIKYRGIEEMQKAGEHPLVYTLDVAISESLRMMNREVERLKKNDVAALYEFVGEMPPDKADNQDTFATYVIAGYEELIKGLSRYQAGGDLREQLVFFEPEQGSNFSDTTAFVHAYDSKNRMFFGPNFRKENIMGRMTTLIHELSHSVLDTHDSFYYDGFATPADFPVEYTEGEVSRYKARAIEENVAMRKGYRAWAHGFRPFEIWLAHNADFWSFYIGSQASPDEYEGLHRMSVDRFNPAAGGRNDSSFNDHLRKFEALRGRRPSQ
ncbi:RHS repeat protein [Pseudomonas capsici]|uniref:RHS repeat-associated core domain-containing protein n=1 Tax=Pseudomonas capsici TaxID=2810614 RepID=UPI000E3D8D23|nr:RHS repeat-associated core domain-containing protein [Pseudomonas capsici]MBX8610327.1 RHS repeat protein [Pseudomonas cichorii]MCV4287026.1 RHS repeat protein [Pseudomonas capsici]